MSKKGTDKWWHIASGSDAFNENRKQTLAAGRIKVLDKSMSAYCLQTTKTGNLLHLSMNARKPELLGTKFKVITLAVTGIFLYLEIQKGKIAMSNQGYNNDNLKTAVCTCHLTKNCI